MATGPLGAYLGYDAAGRLSASVINTNTVSTGYEYDGTELIAERASGGGASFMPMNGAASLRFAAAQALPLRRP